MKKKEKEKVIEKRKAPKGRERKSKIERGKEEKREKKEKKGEKKIKEKEIEKKIKEKKVEKKKKVKKEKEIEKIKFLPQEKVRKKRKPKFIRENFYKIKKLKKKWRRPRGGDSKKRKEKRGKGKVPKIGYKNPKLERNLIKGLKSKLIANPSQLSNIAKGEGIMIDARVGRKKRNEIIREANKLKLTILNPRKGEF